MRGVFIQYSCRRDGQEWSAQKWYMDWAAMKAKLYEIAINCLALGGAGSEHALSLLPFSFDANTSKLMGSSGVPMDLKSFQHLLHSSS